MGFSIQRPGSILRFMVFMIEVFFETARCVISAKRLFLFLSQLVCQVYVLFTRYWSSMD
jgi:hypothetical protein